MSTHGGRRVGAGRPFGSPSKRGPRYEKREALAAIREALEALPARTEGETAETYAGRLLGALEGGLLRLTLATGDSRLAFSVWKELRAAANPPKAAGAAVNVNLGLTPAAVLAEIAEERRQRAIEATGRG